MTLCRTRHTTEVLRNVQRSFQTYTMVQSDQLAGIDRPRVLLTGRGFFQAEEFARGSV